MSDAEIRRIAKRVKRKLATQSLQTVAQLHEIAVADVAALCEYILEGKQ